MKKNFIEKYRLWLVFVPAIIAILLVFPLSKAKINSDLMTYLPSDIESTTNLDKLDELFGEYDPVVLIFETDDVLDDSTLNRVKNLSKAFNRMGEFNRVVSLFDTKNIIGRDGAMIVEPAVKRIPKSESRKERLRESIKNNELAYKLVVSENFRYTIILVNPVNVTDDEAIALIKEQLEIFPGKENVYLNGTPYLRSEIQKKATLDMAILMPIGLLVIVVFLYFSFREKRGVILPFLVVIMSIVVSTGLIPLLGWKLSIMAILVPIMMLAISTNYGIHFISRYQELNATNPDWTIRQIAAEALRHLKKPVILTGLTTIIGILGLVAHIMVPAKQMGMVSAIGIAFALLLSLTFIPALLIGMKKGKPRPVFNGGKKSVIDKMLARAANATTKHPRRVVLVFLAFLVVAGTGILKIKVSINNEEMMPKNHPLRVSAKIANTDLGGTKNVSILFSGDIKNPVLLKRMASYEDGLAKHPAISSVTSIAKVIRIIGKALNDEQDELYGKVPNTRAAVAQYIELYSMGGNPEDFEQLVDFDYENAVMAIQFKANSIKEFDEVMAYIENTVKDDPNVVLTGGFSLVEKELAEAVTKGQINSLVFAVFAIAILLMLIFRSLPAGLIGSLPLVFTLVCNFGLMGWLGMELDIATSLLSSIAIGIGVDYTIHLFWRLKTEIANGAGFAQAITKSLATTGRGIAINAISVIIGFAVLFVSGLALLKTFAFLIIFSLLLCLFCALVFVPALCLILKPEFLAKNGEAVRSS